MGSSHKKVENHFSDQKSFPILNPDQSAYAEYIFWACFFKGFFKIKFWKARISAAFAESGSCTMKKPDIYINKCHFLSEGKIHRVTIACNLEYCIILIFINVPLSDKNIPYMDNISAVHTFNNYSTHFDKY